MVADTAPHHLSARTSHRAHTCTSCGWVQAINPAARRASRCSRCGFKITHPRSAGPLEATLWSLALLALFTGMAQGMFMAFGFAGGTNHIGVAGGALETMRLGSTVVGVAVLMCTVVCPVIWALAMLYVATGLLARSPGPGTTAVLRLLGHMRPWVMPEIFLLGVIVAHGKLAHDGGLSYGQSFYLYLAAAAVWLLIALRIKPGRLWERVMPAAIPATHPADDLVGCQTCGMAQQGHAVAAHCQAACVRCHDPLITDPNGSLRRCVLLLVLAMLMLWPANTVPIMRIAHLGPPEPATVWGGIKVLYFGGSPALAVLVFAASICVPVLKVAGLATLVLCRSPRNPHTARRLAKIHRAIATAGRWSMVDMFVITLLIGLVRLGGLASVDPKPGAVAFLAVVLLSIVAAEALNAKIFWNHTDTQRNG